MNSSAVASCLPRNWRKLIVHISCLALSSCATVPGEYSGLPRDDPNLTYETLDSRAFRHLLVWHQGAPKIPRLHVYLEGDGTPWVRGGREVARDPTPRQPLALHLLRRDPGAALYLGRPCYHGHADDPGCSPFLWTHGRYSEQVVTAMAEVLQAAMRQHQVEEVVLIGYSGGAALARLLAARIPETSALVSVAGLQDSAAWTRWHGYLPLQGSINPASEPALPARIRQIHFFGGLDVNVPGPLIPAGLPGRIVVMPEYDHVCCWVEDWPSLLRQIEAAP